MYTRGEAYAIFRAGVRMLPQLAMLPNIDTQTAHSLTCVTVKFGQAVNESGRTRMMNFWYI